MASLAYGFNYESYKPYNLSDLLAFEKSSQKSNAEEGMQADVTMAFNARLDKFQLQVTYGDGYRPIRGAKRTFVDGICKAFGKDFGFDKSYCDIYQKEIKIIYEDHAYWFPVQEQLVGYFKDEMKKGESMYIYVIYAGSAEGELVVLVSEFDRIE